MPKKGEDAMWCVVMFDLPVTTKTERRNATRFRNMLLDMGFSRAQFSVYAQYLPLATGIARITATLKSSLPSGGDIRILSITDNQWSKMIRFSNAKETKPEETPSQLTIF